MSTKRQKTVVEPREGTEVLAWFEWDLEPEGDERLHGQGLPERFPAVTRRLAPGGGTAYYFAGDFADNLMSDRPWPFAGYLSFKRFTEGIKAGPSESAFFLMRAALPPSATNATSMLAGW